MRAMVSSLREVPGLGYTLAGDPKNTGGSTVIAEAEPARWLQDGRPYGDSSAVSTVWIALQPGTHRGLHPPP
jgi:hypothetical protein